MLLDCHFVFPFVCLCVCVFVLHCCTVAHSKNDQYILHFLFCVETKMEALWRLGVSWQESGSFPLGKSEFHGRKL